MANENESGNPSPEVEAPRHNWWIRLIGYAKRKINERAAKKKNETPADKAARRTAVATIWMAIFTCILAVTSGLTIWILKNQLKEMHEGGIDTHALAEATKNASVAASDQADAAQQFSDTAEEINKHADDSVKAFDKLARASERAITQNQATARLTYRPYMAVTPRFAGLSPDGKLTPTMPSGKDNVEIILAVDVKVVGGSPAADFINSASEVIVGPATTAEQQAMNFDPDYTHSNPTTVIPGDAFTVGSGENPVISAEDFANIKTGSYAIYIVGGLKYRDVFKPRMDRPYEYVYCFQLRPYSMPFATCQNVKPGRRQE